MGQCTSVLLFCICTLETRPLQCQNPFRTPSSPSVPCPAEAGLKRTYHPYDVVLQPDTIFKFSSSINGLLSPASTQRCLLRGRFVLQRLGYLLCNFGSSFIALSLPLVALRLCLAGSAVSAQHAPHTHLFFLLKGLTHSISEDWEFLQ